MGIYSGETSKYSKRTFTILEGVIYDEEGRYKADYEDMSIPYDELRYSLDEEESKRRRARFLKEFSKGLPKPTVGKYMILDNLD